MWRRIRVDILSRWKIGEKIMPEVLDKGFVELVDSMGDDSSIVQAARVSYGAGTKTKRSDSGLIKYLMRNNHRSPFEMVEFKFHIKAPLFTTALLLKWWSLSFILRLRFLLLDN